MGKRKEETLCWYCSEAYAHRCFSTPQEDRDWITATVDASNTETTVLRVARCDRFRPSIGPERLARATRHRSDTRGIVTGGIYT